MHMDNYMMVPEIIQEHEEWERYWRNPEDCYDSYSHVDYPNYKVYFCDWNLLDTCPDLPHIRLDNDDYEDEDGHHTLIKVFLNDLDDDELRETLDDFFEQVREEIGY